MDQINRVSAVVSIYNEEKYLCKVINALISSKIFSEIIAVNDGSTDQSLKLLRKYGDKIKLISFPLNRGKSYAMVSGIRKASGEIIFFCDADLVSIKKSHILGVIEPINFRLADQAIAIRLKELSPFRKLSGERAYLRKDLLPLLKRLEDTKYGAETFLNHVFASKRTYWYCEKGLSQAGKKGKAMIYEVLAVDEYLKELYEILREIFRQKSPLMKKEVKKFARRVNLDYWRYLKLIKNFLIETFE